MTPLIPLNSAKRKLAEGSTIVGTMVVELRQPSVMQVLSNAGFDFVLIDNEHGPFGIETIADLSRAARLFGVTPIVRVPDLTYADITRPLDAGAQGIMVPRITHAGQVQEVVQIIKYPPQGRRGSVVARGHTEFRSGPVVEAMADSNKETMLIVQIETADALKNLEEILSVPGVDVALVGPNDLSIAMGIPGKYDDPNFIKALERVVESCRKLRVAPGIHMNEIDRAMAWAGRGMKLVSINSEIGLLTKSGREATEALRTATAKHR